jgi:hypothetical protein
MAGGDAWNSGYISEAARRDGVSGRARMRRYPVKAKEDV